MRKKKCLICFSGTLIIKHKKKGVITKNRLFKLKKLDIRCALCGDNIQNHIESKENKQISRDLNALINGLLSSAEVRKIRKQLNLTQKNAARICGGGPNAFSRYERGETTLLRSTSNLLRVLSRHPEEIEHLMSYCDY